MLHSLATVQSTRQLAALVHMCILTDHTIVGGLETPNTITCLQDGRTVIRAISRDGRKWAVQVSATLALRHGFALWKDQ